MNRISVPLNPFKALTALLQHRIQPNPQVTRTMGVSPAVLGERSFARAHSEFQRARRCIQASKDLMKLRHDSKVSGQPAYTVGQRVWFSTQNLGIRHPSMRHKLLPKYWGPFKVLRLVGRLAVKLDFPEHLKIHRVVSVSLTKPYKSRVGAANEPVVIQGQQEWELEDILAHSIHSSRHKSTVEFRVLWKGPFEDSWHDPCDFANSQDVLRKYLYRLTASVRKKVVKLFDAQSLARLPSELQRLAQA